MNGFDWTAFLTLAEELLEQSERSDVTASSQEAAWRTAISRAYYAAFLSARSDLRRRGVDIPAGGAAHRAVWDAFHTMQESRARRVANDGRRLRARRAIADYENHYPNPLAHARLAVRLAERLLADLRDLQLSSEDV